MGSGWHRKDAGQQAFARSVLDEKTRAGLAGNGWQVLDRFNFLTGNGGGKRNLAVGPERVECYQSRDGKEECQKRIVDQVAEQGEEDECDAQQQVERENDVDAALVKKLAQLSQKVCPLNLDPIRIEVADAGFERKGFGATV